MARGALLLLGLVFFVKGLRELWQSPPEKPVLAVGAPGSMFWTLSWIAAGVIGTMAIAGFLYMVRTLPPAFVNSSVHATEALLILPLLLTALAFVLQRVWIRLPEPGRWRRLFAGESGLIALLAIVPLVALLALAQFRPILNQRGLLFTSPYILLLLGAGIVSLKRKVWIAALAPVLVIACIASYRSYGQMMVDPTDYAGFAKAIQSEIGASDLVFVRKAWYETPILYYLHKDRYRLVSRDFERACARNPEARVWVVLLYDDDPAREMQTALTGYRALKTITAPKAKAILYEHRTT
jgi:hypothetical protein